MKRFGNIVLGMIMALPMVGQRAYVFSVSADREVLFSPGNLQYNAALGTHECADGSTKQGTWRFAEHQYDYVGDAAIGNVYQDGVKCNNELISDTYDGWIDLFGWGTSGWNSGANAYQPWAKSKVIEDYCPGGDPTNNLTGAYAFADWGIYNAIDDDPSGTWRTMSTEEWIYLLHKRADYAHLFGYGTVNGIQGLILLPDSWQIPEDIPFTPSTEKGLVWQEDHYESTRNHYSDNIYTLLQWSKMEASGAVFLPCVGWRNGVSTTETDLYGDYWSTSSGEESAAYFLRFRADELNPQYGYNRYRGRSVRLVKDSIIIPTYEPKPFSVSDNKKVTFAPGNLQYNAAKGTHECADGSTKQGTWRFAENQWDYVGDAENGNVYENGVKCDNTLISETYNGWIDLFGWGTSGWNSGANEYLPWATSENDADYYLGGNQNNHLTGSYAYADWGIYNAIGDDPSGTWRTMTKDEWVYLFHERANAEKLFALGTVNGVQGTIILPDEWETPQGLTFTLSTEKGLVWEGGQYTNANSDNYSHNTYTTAQWALMEAAGAVFIPAGGRRDSNTVKNASLRGFCWSSSTGEDGNTYILRFTTEALQPQHVSNRYRARAVRLVKDSVILPTYVPKPFSVSTNKKVTFSPGNLQYNAAQGTHECADGTMQQGTWRFAEHQWDYVGDAANGTVYENGVKCDNALLSDTYDGWIDLFGWGTSGWSEGIKAYQPWATSKTQEDYYPGGSEENNLTGDYAYADWGQYNAVGNDPAGTWRTLTEEEWRYLFEERPGYAELRGHATVNGVHGYILLPDEWTMPDGMVFKSGANKNFQSNVYEQEQWQAMETAGAVFFPAAGSRDGKELTSISIGNRVAYWAVTACDSNKAYRFSIISGLAEVSCNARYLGRPVRLVKEVEAPPDEGCTDVTTEFDYTMYKGETYLWEGTEYKTSGDHTKTFPKADGCDSIVTLHLTVLSPECLGNYDTVRFCPDLNTEHDEVVRHGYCLRYLPYRYESPAEWDFMEGVILVRDSDRTLVDLARAERNLKEHYTDDFTPVQSVHWSLCKNGANDYHAVTVESEAQWIEAGTLSLSVYFMCGQKYYTDFTTDLSDVQGGNIQCTKVLLNGHIFIFRGEHVYDAQGRKVR